MEDTELQDAVELDIQIGENRLRVKGARDVVAVYFDAWKRLTFPQADASAAPTEPRKPEAVLALDPTGKSVVLRARLHGKAAEADSVLLLLHGHHQLFGSEGQEVRATKLSQSILASGLRQTRLDRILARHLRARLVKKSGSRKATSYRLTPEGTERATALEAAIQEAAKAHPA